MSQTATTFEQSKRLLAAGLDPESADMKYVRFDDEIPAWSLSALWDFIHHLDKTYEFPTTLSAEKLIEVLTATICYRLEHQ